MRGENRCLPSRLKQFVSSPSILLHCNDTSVTSEQHQTKKFGRRSSSADSKGCSSLQGLCLKVTRFVKDDKEVQSLPRPTTRDVKSFRQRSLECQPWECK